MSDRKRDANQVVSPKKNTSEKKRKDDMQKENDFSYARPKTKYIFAPSNKLSSSTPLKQIKHDPNVPKKESISPAIKPPREIVRSDNHSSDDHVFWAPTPKQNKQVPQQQTATTSNEKRRNPPSSPLTDELRLDPVEGLSSKYQSIVYDNFASQRSPTALKVKPRKSQSFPTHNLIKKPSSEKSKLIPSRSFTNSPSTPFNDSTRRRDITSLISAVESGFQPDPNDFELTDTTKKSILKDIDMTTASPEVVKAEPKKTSTPGFDFSSDFFSDDFSDDFMNDLDKAIEKKSQTQPKVEENNMLVKSDLEYAMKEGNDGRNFDVDAVAEKLSQNHIIEDPIPSDEFDDMDDEEFDQMLDKKLTQPPALLSISNHTPKLTTQEERIKKVDFEGLKIFKKDIDETDLRQESFKKSTENLAKCAVQRDGVKRLQLVNVLTTFYTQMSKKKQQKILTGIDADGTTFKVVVRDPWVNLDFEPNDVIHIVGKNFKVVDRESDNLLIWNPDLLLSATLIGDTINCNRRSVLKTKLDFRGDTSVALIVGEIVHRLFQASLRENQCSMEFLQDELKEHLDDQILSILVINETKESIKEEVFKHIPYIQSWFQTHVANSPSTKSNIRVSGKREQTLFSTSNILDIEENIWSPIYGLRGLIDVTIEANLKNAQKAGKFIAPLELKSGGRAQLTHSIQASLYTLLLKDRYEMDVGFFMLVYTKLKETTKYEINENELKDLVMCRNVLSKYLKESSRMLPDLQNSSECDHCYAISECMTYNKLMEDGSAVESGLKENVYDDLTGHLNSEKHKLFFNYWDDLITKEEGSINLLKRDLFLIDGPTREKTSGKCLSNLVIKSATDEDQDENRKYFYTFERKKEGMALNSTQLSKHDRIIVSDEAGHFALCSGWVVSIRANEVVISTNRRLKNNNVKLDDFNIENNQTYQTVLKPMSGNGSQNRNVTYRIDKDEMFHGMRLARYNLLNLFLKDGDHARRELIVEERKPTFKENPTQYALPENHSFNSDQIKAFDKVFSANDYTLLLGMPGTGKTTVIAQLIKMLVSQNKTVLLTSYTHSAVDNILLKVKDDGIGIVRLGSPSRIHPEIKQFSPHQKDIKTKADLNQAFLDPPVVATTCLGISDWIFNTRRFDYCIVDESSQVSMPVCLGPLGFCDRFVLVGDHYQLPPLIINPDARAGLSKSLFKTLSEKFPEAVVDLAHQYRMCSDIMLLSNTIIYEGRLKCGSEEIANQSLKIPNMNNLKGTFPENLDIKDRWIENILDENKKVLFLNHDPVGGCEETSSKENIENVKEADLIFQIVEAMLLCGVPESSIGVMSFYRAQLRLFYRKFARRKDIEMLTADQFQGRDKDCVIISLVKSNDRNDAGSLLKEWRRVNVAITRARAKLIIVGSKRTLQNLRTINAFMNILDTRGWFYDLPFKADTFYSFAVPPNPEDVDSITTTTAKVSKTKHIAASRAIQNRQLTKDIAAEMGL